MSNLMHFCTTPGLWLPASMLDLASGSNIRNILSFKLQARTKSLALRLCSTCVASSTLGPHAGEIR